MKVKLSIVCPLVAACALTGLADDAIKVSVDLGKVKSEVPRTLYGTGMEDVNHEIYGGLDAQRLYAESFEEGVPPDRKEQVCKWWTPVATGKGAFELDWRAVHLGQSAQVLAPNGDTAGVASMGLNGWGVPCREGKAMKGWFFARKHVDALEVALQSHDGVVTYARQSVPCPNDGEWRKIEFSLVPNTTDPKARFLISAFGNGKVWIDDVYLADEPTNEFGRLGCREDIVAAFRKEGLTFLRWGGSMANSPEYLLKNMQGDRRPYIGFWFKWSSTGFLYKEFVRMANAMKLPCAFSIFAYEDTDEAVKLAEWLKQFEVDVYVEIGNEECATFTPACGERTIESVRRYGASVRRLVPAMRRANPRLKFFSAMHWSGIDQKLLDESFRLTDGIVEYWDLHTWAGGTNCAHGVRGEIAKFRDMVRRINPKSTMKAAIFEENGNNHDMKRAIAHATTLEAAREAGDLIFTSCPANALQAWRQNDNGWDQGQIFFTTDKVWLQPCGWAQQMASANHRDILVEGRTSDGIVTVSATRDRAGTSIVLHLVNCAGAPKKLAFDFGSDQLKLVKATSLSAPRLTDDNPPEDPDRISPKDVTDAFRDDSTVKPYSYTVLEYAPAQ